MNDKHRWRRIEQLFDRTVDLPRAARDRRLEDACAGDARLRAEVEALLAADTRTPAFLDHATRLWPAMASPATSPELSGSCVGPYTIAERLGAGGMGEVYAATRPVGDATRQVAIKILKRGLDTDALLRRFAREQSTLASLEHPHIVRFLDAGSLEDGRPYLVMERVHGEPLTTSCDLRELDVDARLRLFLDVCSAVQHAHTHLIVHRDLKPSNVLVDGSGHVKLLDFGVAKLLEASEDGETTRVDGAPPLSLAYASPELIAGRRASTATDVYSLGVMLFELLTGRRPPPSPRDEPPTASAFAPARLARRLRGDIDAILVKALQERARQRYASVAGLADDVRRHLDGEAVVARPEHAAARLLRTIRRHRTAALTTTAVMLALLVGWSAATLSLRDARSEASLGWGAHAQAKLVGAALGDLVVAAERSPAAFDLAVEDLETRIDTEFAAMPETEALLRLALGRAALETGEASRAIRSFERAADLAARTRGLTARDRLHALLGLVEAHHERGHEVAARATLALASAEFGGAEANGAAWPEIEVALAHWESQLP